MTQPSATEIVGGSQIPLDAAYIANLVARNLLDARGQDIDIRGQDLARRGQDMDFGLTQRGQDITQRGQDQTFWSNLMALGEERRQADLMYQQDAARFGLDTAAFNYQQRLGKIQADLAKNDQLLTQESFNFAQRSGLVDRKLGIVDMLTSRQGPQDYVAYNSLLNQLSPPDPQRSAEIDPFQMLEGLVRELELPDVDTSKLDQPFAGAFPSLAQASAESSRLNPLANMQPPEFGTVGSLTAPSGNLSTVRGFGSPNQASSGFFDRNTPDIIGPAGEPGSTFIVPNNEIPYGDDQRGGVIGGVTTATGDPRNHAAGYAIGPGGILPPYEQGGMAQGNAIEVLTGDRAKGDKPNPEVVQVVSRDPATKMVVTPVERLTRDMPRAETGGVYGTATTDPNLTFNQYDPETLGNAPFLRKALGQAPTPPFQGFGSEVSNPSIGVENFPSTLNLAAFRDLAPTERLATQSVAEQGLGLDFRDILERSRRAAPFGAEFGVSRFTRV